METRMGRLKGIFFNVIVAALFCGCAAHRDQIKDAALPPMAEADVVKVQDSLEQPIAVNAITNKERIVKFSAFVSTLPQQWRVPWYGFGSPIGKVYFYFYKDGTCVGNFYVGPNFFGRNANYTDGLFDFFSQPATKTQIQELGQIVGFDVWKFSRGSPLL